MSQPDHLSTFGAVNEAPDVFVIPLVGELNVCGVVTDVLHASFTISIKLLLIHVGFIHLFNSYHPGPRPPFMAPPAGWYKPSICLPVMCVSCRNAVSE